MALFGGREARILKSLRKQGVQYGQLEIADIHGILRGKITAPEELIEGTALSNGLLSIGSDDEVVVTPLLGFESGLDKLPIIPDLSTLKVLPWRGDVASVICDFCHNDGTPYLFHPRQILKEAQEKLKSMSYDTKVGLELEFFLFYEDDELLRNGRHRDLKKFGRDRHAYSINRSPTFEPLAKEFIARMASVGVHIEAFHTEYGVGMYECAFSPMTALDAADAWCRMKTYLKELCREHGLVTSFMPVLAMDPTDTSTGTHHNVSLWDGPRNIFWNSRQKKLSQKGEHFAAGVLSTMQDFHLFFRPFVNSYRRFDVMAFNPTHVSWGLQNQFASLSINHGNKPKKHTRFEHRVAGSDICIYLTLASILLGGMHGMKKKMTLPSSIDGTLPADSKAEMLSNSLPKATENFRKSAIAKKLLGKDFVEHYAALKDAEWEFFETWAKENGESADHNNLEVTQWEYDHYFEWV